MKNKNQSRNPVFQAFADRLTQNETEAEIKIRDESLRTKRLTIKELCDDISGSWMEDDAFHESVSGLLRTVDDFRFEQVRLKILWETNRMHAAKRRREKKKAMR